MKTENALFFFWGNENGMFKLTCRLAHQEFKMSCLNSSLACLEQMFVCSATRLQEKVAEICVVVLMPGRSVCSSSEVTMGHGSICHPAPAKGCAFSSTALIPTPLHGQFPHVSQAGTVGWSWRNLQLHIIPTTPPRLDVQFFFLSWVLIRWQQKTVLAL